MTTLLDTLPLPAGLRELSDAELEQVAEEVRNELITSVSRSGGHFASSLGAAELTVALHATFDTPNDKLVWVIKVPEQSLTNLPYRHHNKYDGCLFDGCLLSSVLQGSVEREHAAHQTEAEEAPENS